MNTAYLIVAISIASLCFSLESEANWLNKETNSLATEETYPSNNTNNSNQTIPESVTQDWLTGLRDENGNEIISYNKTFPAKETENDNFNITSNLSMTGETSSSNFGIAVSSAGDVNGDGYSDVIVGASGYNSSTGRAYIFYGGSPMNNVADVTMTGEGTGNQFGVSVNSAGDVNLDSYSDVIVGASGFFTGAGRAYIFYGGAPMNNVADLFITGSPNENLGISVAPAGNVNGDAFPDVIVGATGFSFQTGRAYILYGGSSMDNSPDVTMTGETSSNSFGFSVSKANDVNNDGFSDVIVGAIEYNSYTGRAYVFYGGSSMNNVADVTMTGEASGARFGWSVSPAGNVNGDFFSDVIVGSFAYSTNTGRAYIFYGGPTMNNVADVTMTGLFSNNRFGFSVSSGNVNGDIYSDAIVGAPGIDNFTGKAYVFFGGASMDNSADVTMGGEGLNHFFGTSVSSGGDLNADGYQDIIVGANGYSPGGKTYIYYSLPASSLNFDGLDDNVALPNSLTSAATGGNAITIEYWFKGYYLRSAVRFQPTGGDYIVSGWNGYHIISTDGGLSGIPVGPGAEDGNWHHVAMTWQKNTVSGFKSYLDGNLVFERNSANVNLPDMNSGGYLGSFLGSMEFMIGSLDEVRIWNRALPQNEIQTFMNCELINPRPGLLAYYKFNHGIHGGINNTVNTLTDYSGNNYNASLSNFALTGLNSNWLNPGGVTSGILCFNQIASALNFDGYNDFVGLPEALNYVIGGTTAITIEYWFKGTDNQSAVRFQDFSDRYIVAGWFGKHIISSDGGTVGGISQGAAVTDGNWHHVTMTWQKNTVNGFRSFLDGQLVEQRNSANVNLPSINGLPPTISSYNANFEFTLGTLDEVRIWNRALTQSEIQLHMYCEIPTSAPGLILNYHFNHGFPSGNNGSVTNLDDFSGNGYNGILYEFNLAGSTSNWISPGGVISGTSCTGGIFNITAVPQGFYNSSLNTSNRRDTVRSYLRSNFSPYNVIDFAKTVFDSTGLNGTFTFANASDGTYYLQLIHRNSIETWSKPGGEFYNTENFNSYDFTPSASQAFGNNMIQVDNSPVRFAIYSGDVNQDGTIDLTDIILCFNDANLFMSGYVNTDLTGDDFVDLTDITIAFNNSNNFVSKITP